jgi:hypothetical protein
LIVPFNGPAPFEVILSGFAGFVHPKAILPELSKHFPNIFFGPYEFIPEWKKATLALSSESDMNRLLKAGKFPFQGLEVKEFFWFQEKGDNMGFSCFSEIDHD